MRRLIILLVVLATSGAALAQTSSGLVRRYAFDRSGSGASNLCDTSIGCPTLGIWFGQAVAATYAADVGAYTLTVNGNPTRVSGPVWPSGLVTPGYNWRFDETGDSLSVADAGGAFSSQAAWSVSCTIIPRAGFASGDVFAAKWNTTGNKRSWRLYTGGTSVVLDISSDGAAGTITTLTKAASIAANRLSHITASCDGAGNCSLWVDELAVATSAAMGDPFEGDAAFSIGADAEGAGDVPADFFRCVYQDGQLVAADHQRANRRFRGLYDGSGNNPVTVTAATMPALPLAYPTSGVSPFIIDMPANSNAIGAVASGSGGLYGSSAIVNKCWRSSFETGAALTGWVIADGGTTGACAQATVAPVHGSATALCTTADADDAVTLTSGCATVTGGTAMWLSAWLKTASGTGLVDVNILEDDSADCATPTTTTAVVNDAVPGADWARYSGAITLQAGTIRAQVQISLPAAAAQTTYADAVTFRAGIATDAFCTADTDADASCSTMVQSVPDNGSLISANGSSSIVGTFRSPWAGTDLTANLYLYSDGIVSVSTADTISSYLAPSTDEVAFFIKDAAANSMQVAPNAANWAAATDYVLKVRRDGMGKMGLWWNAAWQTTTAGAGTGIRSASQALFYICGGNAAGSDVWARSVEFYRRMVQ